MKRCTAILALMLAASPMQVLAEEAAQQELSLEQKTLLRCSAAFAIIASEQARGIETANRWPPLGTRGREYFVQAGAQLMDELELSEEQLQELYRQEINRLQAESGQAGDPQEAVGAIMQPCLLMLDASGL